MKTIIPILLNLLRGENLVKLLASFHIGVDTSRTCYFCYKEFHLDILNVLFILMIVGFYIAKVIWRKNHNHPEDKKERRITLALTWILHFLFIGFFLYVAIKYNHWELFFIEIIIYIGFELMMILTHLGSKKINHQKPVSHEKS